MCRVVAYAESIAFFQRRLALLQAQADSVRTFVEVIHHVAFTSYPVRNIRRGAGHGIIKQRLPRKLDFDGDGQAGAFCSGFQCRSQFPGGIMVKVTEGQRRFLFGQRLQIIIDIHSCRSSQGD
ncbi:hypothetical protein D3C73_1340890 [compost metagenome]